MKICGYCGRENEDVALRCPGCGTCIPVSSANSPDDPGQLRLAPHFSSSVAGGMAVILICTGIVILTRRLLPGIYLLSLSLMAWMVVLTFVALALTLYAGSVCCRTRLQRAAFTLIVLVALAFEGALLLPGETGLGSRGSWVTAYGGSGLLIITGALTLARVAGRTSHCSPKRDVGALAPGGDWDMPGEASSKPVLSVKNVICVVAGLLLMSFLAFWVWILITPHW